MQDETRIIQSLGFGVSYIRDFTVWLLTHVIEPKGYFLVYIIKDSYGHSQQHLRQEFTEKWQLAFLDTTIHNILKMKQIN